MVATTPAKRVNQDNTKPSMNWEQTRDAPTNTTQAAVRPTIKASRFPFQHLRWANETHRSKRANYNKTQHRKKNTRIRAIEEHHFWEFYSKLQTCIRQSCTNASQGTPPQGRILHSLLPRNPTPIKMLFCEDHFQGKRGKSVKRP